MCAPDTGTGGYHVRATQYVPLRMVVLRDGLEIPVPTRKEKILASASESTPSKEIHDQVEATFEGDDGWLSQPQTQARHKKRVRRSTAGGKDEDFPTSLSEWWVVHALA